MEILRKKTKPILKIDNKLINLIQNMFYTMDKSSGIGLAAPQINLGISLAVIDLSENLSNFAFSWFGSTK